MAKRKIAVAVVCSVSVIIGIVMNNSQVRTNNAGLELIGNAESCRSDPYVCPAGILTDGIGNTHGVVDDTRKTDEQIAADWQKTSMRLKAALINTSVVISCRITHSAKQ